MYRGRHILGAGLFSLGCLLTIPSAAALGCFSANDCTAGSACVRNSCAPCERDDQCPGNRCTDGVCSACTIDDQCPGGSRCIGGACTFCTADIDCDRGQLCVVGQCLTASAVADLPPFCGNHRVDEGEACDDGSANSVLSNASCRADCTAAGCGDGVIDDPFELCDDGNRADGDGCSSLCQPETDTESPRVTAQMVGLPLGSGEPPVGSSSGTRESVGHAALAIMGLVLFGGFAWLRRKS